MKNERRCEKQSEGLGGTVVALWKHIVIGKKDKEQSQPTEVRCLSQLLAIPAADLSYQIVEAVILSPRW